MGSNHEKIGCQKSCDTHPLKEHCHEILYLHFFHDSYPSEHFDFAKLFTNAKNSMRCHRNNGVKNEFCIYVINTAEFSL